LSRAKVVIKYVEVGRSDLIAFLLFGAVFFEVVLLERSIFTNVSRLSFSFGHKIKILFVHFIQSWQILN